MPSPRFSINGNPAGQQAAVSAASPVMATLDSVDGVTSVEWSIVSTDELHSPANYGNPAISGSIGQTAQWTSLTAGTSAGIKCRINGGRGLGGEPDATATIVQKFFVVTAQGLEVLNAGEIDPLNVQSSATHGAAKPINEVIRKLDALSGSAEQVVGRVLTTTSAFATFSGYTPHPALDNNPVLWSEGGLALSHAGYTTKSALSRLRVSAGVTLAATSGTVYLASLHIGIGNSLVFLPRVFGNSFLPENIGPVFYDVASPGASQSYVPKLRVVPVVGNTDFYVNGDSSGHTLGGKWLTWIEVEEYIPAP